jgi:hypothetical protein
MEAVMHLKKLTADLRKILLRSTWVVELLLTVSALVRENLIAEIAHLHRRFV